MSFVKRVVEVSVALSGGGQTNQPKQFSESGTDTTTLSGSRTKVRIENSGSPTPSKASVEIYGLTPSIMNQLSTLGLLGSIVERNTMAIQAGDAESGLSTVFSGTIFAAYADYDQQPNVPFRFECQAGLISSVVPAVASSFPKATDVATVMAGFAGQLSLGFENNGVTAQMPPQYLSGSAMTQMRKYADAAGIMAEQVGNVLAIWPKGGNRSTTIVPEISPETGMINSPAFTQNGIIVKTLFNPKIAFGGLVSVKSAVLAGAQQSQSASLVAALPANGQWAVYKLDHALDSQVPKGDWMSTVHAFNPKSAQPVAPGPRG